MWVKFKECGELLSGRRFALRLKRVVYRIYIIPAILYGSEMGILRMTERSMMRIICGVQLKEKKISMDFMFMLGLKETMDQLAMENSVRWYGHVLRRKDGHVLGRALDFVVEGQRKNGRPKRTWKKV